MATTTPRPQPSQAPSHVAAQLGLVSCLACACAFAAATATAQPAADAADVAHARAGEPPGLDLAPVLPHLERGPDAGDLGADLAPARGLDGARGPALAPQAAPRRRGGPPPIAFESSYQAGAPGMLDMPSLTVPGRVHVPLPLAGAGRAFEREMREETLRSRRAGLFAYIPPELPELLEDDFIRDQRARVAERVIGASMEAAFGEALIGTVRKQHGLRLTPSVSRVNVESGLKIDASPTWTWRRTTPRTGMRVDVPIGPSNFRVHAWKDLRGTNTTPMRMGTALSVDPFDQSVSAGFSFEF